MKFIFSCFFFLPFMLSAQRYSDAFNINGGFVLVSNGYGIGIGCEKFIKQVHSISGRLYYLELRKPVSKTDIIAHLNESQIEINYNFYFWELGILYPHLSIGSAMEYESITNSHKFTSDIVLDYINQLSFKSQVGLGAELNLKKISFFTLLSTSYNFKNKDINTMHILGAKLYF